MGGCTSLAAFLNSKPVAVSEGGGPRPGLGLSGNTMKQGPQNKDRIFGDIAVYLYIVRTKDFEE